MAIHGFAYLSHGGVTPMHPTAFRMTAEPPEPAPDWSVYTAPSPCQTCDHYHGRGYGHAILHCAMHPHGPQGESCEDWEATSVEDVSGAESAHLLNNSLESLAEGVGIAVSRLADELIAVLKQPPGVTVEDCAQILDVLTATELERSNFRERVMAEIRRLTRQWEKGS